MITIGRDIPAVFLQFPNKETLIQEHTLEIPFGQPSWITLKYQDDKDLMNLMFLKKYYDQIGQTIETLLITYMPYSRMDRSESGSAFTLKYVAEFINSLQFKRVLVVEPHSDVTMALLDRSRAIYPTMEHLEEVLSKIGFDKSVDLVFFPDAGAQKRYMKSYRGPYAVGFKQRNFQTGVIGKTQVLGIEKPPRRVLIVDDLCSRGGTFMGAGTALKELGAEEVYLFVTHCEDTVFQGDVLSGSTIDGVYTFDTMARSQNHPKLHEMRLFQ